MKPVSRKATPPKKSSAVKKQTIDPFPIVAIGASAGGLEAITELLRNVPANTGMAFIYVQHLSPDHKSMLAAILAKITPMNVQEVKNKVVIAPNHVYIIPPDKEMNIINGHVKLSPRSKDSKINLPIDIFFSSLAAAHKENVIGVILSGSASDGTRGMKSIKHEGGLTFAQDKTAKFNSMPRSAIAAGAVDFVLSPKQIALELERISKHPFIKTNGSKIRNEDLIEHNNRDLRNILNLLLKETGVAFNAYKIKTVKRRILRRMLLHKIKGLKDYAKLLNEKRGELDILFQDLLINVTSFFRDAETYKYLKSTLFPRLLKSKGPTGRLRIWVPACSTGEEAFSIAMLLLEIQDTKSANVSVQIFATDLSEKAVRKARLGSYSSDELESVSPKRIQRFFTKSNGGYRIVKAIRDICVFSPHNVLQDPPFSRLDFISCRNLFIYLEPAAQKRATATFHYALNEGGYLMLGKSEALSTAPQLFKAVNSKLKIFVRRSDVGALVLPALTMRLPRDETPPVSLRVSKPGKSGSLGIYNTEALQGNGSLDSAIDAVLVTEFMPASVVINYQLEILQFRGSTDLYLTHAAGRATFNILKMARPELVFGLRNAISSVIRTKNRVHKRGIEMKIKRDVHIINLDVIPLKIEWNEPLILILFSEQMQTETFLKQYKGAPSTGTKAKDQRIKKLEEELAVAHADALAYAQEQEAFNEELQSTSEEVVSSNEELQTVNEELETSKEEIESANEELTTTIQELQTRNDLLNESYEYSNAIISTLHEPMIVLDKHLRVKTASKAFYKKFDVREGETEGVLLYDLGNKQWNIPRLRELLEDIIPKNSTFHDFEVKHTFPKLGERILILNASRIEQKRHGDQLILLSIQDVTEKVRRDRKEKELLQKDIAESKSYNIQLEKAVVERTKELEKAHKALAEKFVELEKMNKELEAFTYVSSHDLQEPLRKIRIFSDRILETEGHLTEGGKNYFRLMRTSAERMQALISDLLIFSRLNTSKHKFETVDLRQLVEEIKIDFSEHIHATNAVLEANQLCEVRVIPFQFKQLLTNLLSNAFKFAKPGIPPHVIVSGKHVKSSTIKTEEKLLPQQEYYHIRITDNGIGFENKYRKKIFDVFERLHSKDEYPGTGIGLAIVKKIVDNHRGIISATGELKKGTTINVYIPAN
jgi:two-component system, chemotaxis family, CheB/CheR fusion protein